MFFSAKLLLPVSLHADTQCRVLLPTENYDSDYLDPEHI